MAWKTRRQTPSEPPGYPGAIPIERIGPPARDVFRERYVRANRPVVIVGAMEGWRARGWTLDYLAAAAGEQGGEILASSTALFPDYETRPEPMAKVKMPLRELAERAAGGWPGPPVVAAGETYYLYGQTWLFEAAPWLLDDLATPPFLGGLKVASTTTWVSTGGAITPLHYDLENGLLAQVVGEKHVVLFAPSFRDRLYFRGQDFPGMNNFDRQSQVDIRHPDPARFPAFAGAVAHEHLLRPGEMLFLPSTWPHEVETLSTSVSVGFPFAGGTATSEFAVLAEEVQRAARARPGGAASGVFDPAVLERALRENPSLVDEVLRSPIFKAMLDEQAARVKSGKG